MARRPNYGGAKREKEIKRQKKKAEKDEKRRLKKEGAAESQADSAETSGVDDEAADGDRVG